MTTLWLLEYVEMELPQDHRATLCLVVAPDAVTEEELREIIALGRCRLLNFSMVRDNIAGRREFTCEISWRSKRSSSRAPGLVDQLASRAGIQRLSWNPQINQGS